MPWLSYIDFCGAVAYLLMAVYVLAKNYRSWLNISCAVLMLCFAIWSFFSVYVHNPQVPKEIAFTAVAWESLGWSFFSFVYLWFVAILTERKKIYQSPWFYLVGISLSSSLIYLQWHRLLVIDLVPVYYGWALVWSRRAVACLLYFSYPAFVAIAVYFLIDFRKKVPDTMARYHMSGVMLSTLVAIVIGSVTNVVLPMLNFHVIPEIANLVAFVWAIYVVHSIAIYKIMTITPAMAADNIIAAMDEGLVIADNRGKIIAINPALCRLLGYTTPELKNKDLSLFLDFDQHSFAQEDPAPSSKSRDYVLTAKNGDLIPVILAISPLSDIRGFVHGVVCIATDIREQKKEETGLRLAHTELEKRVNDRTAQLRTMSENLAQESQRLLITLRSIADAVIVTDLDGIVVLINDAAEKLTGYSRDDATGRLIYDIFVVIEQKTRVPITNPVKTVLVSNRPASIPGGTALVAKNGQEIAIDDSAAPIRGDDGRLMGAVLVFRDITGKKRMEEEALKSLKLESLGLLAGGIAHDFNNILTGILTSVSFVKEASDKKSSHYQLLADAEYAVLRAKDLTHQLLTFAKGGAPVKKISSIADILRDTATFILAGSACRCDIDIDYSLWHADVDTGQISQVIQNLLLNSIQAMPQGGVITLNAQNIKIVSGSPAGLPVGNYIQISVHDTGIGIDPRYLPNIFDPYFTTKAKGSGLGLATSYSIIKKHNGLITVESQLGKGTVFHIYLPAASGPLAKLDQPKRGKPVGALSARVLIMDDEDMILSTAKNILVAAGCSVDCAVSGDEVIARYKQAKSSGKPYDVFILDLVIPAGLGGKETLAVLRELDPGVKAIVSSGYSNDPVMADFAAYGFKGIVAKPYTAQELLQAVYCVVENTG